jgi:predicted transposase YdaD
MISGKSAVEWRMSISDNIHDKLFKSAMTDLADANAELRAILPSALRARLDWDTLAPVPGNFVDDAMRGSHADLLFSVSHQGKASLLYVLCEHKSEVDKWTLLRRQISKS